MQIAKNESRDKVEHHPDNLQIDMSNVIVQGSSDQAYPKRA